MNELKSRKEEKEVNEIKPSQNGSMEARKKEKVADDRQTGRNEDNTGSKGGSGR